MSQPPRMIKKYPNRRLYDTDTGRYITLSGVRRLVCDHIRGKSVQEARAILAHTPRAEISRPLFGTYGPDQGGPSTGLSEA